MKALCVWGCIIVRVLILTLVHHRKCLQWAWEHQNWTTMQWKKVAWPYKSCGQSGVCPDTSLTCGGDVTRMHCGKKASWRSVFWMVLLGMPWVLKLGGCYFHLYHLPKYCCNGLFQNVPYCTAKMFRSGLRNNVWIHGVDLSSKPFANGASVHSAGQSMVARVLQAVNQGLSLRCWLGLKILIQSSICAGWISPIHGGPSSLLT